jgi:sphingolipid delta-4 desaturase
MAWFMSDKPWYIVLPLAWAISGTINHCLSLAGHELSHGLGFHKQWHNDAMAFVCNIAMGFPSAITFRKYHHLHHMYQGVDHIDTDIPTAIEAKIILNNRLTKLLFLSLQPMFYALRPQIMYPLRRTTLENINWVIVVGADVLVYYFWGGKALFYLAGGTLLGLSLHPMAGHFLAEHYVWDPKYETHSYYGPLNFFGWNVGYHVEHHDFPKIPGSRLPMVHEIAKEYYPTNPNYQSWVAVMWNFVMDEDMGTYNRVTRSKDTHNRERKRILEENRTPVTAEPALNE